MTSFEKALRRMDKGFERFIEAQKQELQRQKETHRKLMEIINDPENKELLGGVK